MSTFLAAVLLSPSRAQAQAGPKASPGTAAASSPGDAGAPIPTDDADAQIHSGPEPVSPTMPSVPAAPSVPPAPWSATQPPAPPTPPAISVSTTAAIPTAPPVVSTTAPVAAPSASSGVVPRPWVIGDIAFKGNKNVKAGVIRSEVKAKKGDLYDRPDLDRDIQNIQGLGNFERVAADITATGLPVPEHFAKVAGSSTTIKLTFFVTEKPLIKKIKFEGNKKVSKGVLSDAITLKSKDPLDLVKLKEDEGKIVAKYNEKGFLDASVTSKVETDTAALQSVVTFTMAEGPKSRIAEVTIDGVKSFRLDAWWPRKSIKRLMKNRRKKVFFEKDLREDTKKIETFYLNNGYLDVVVTSPTWWTSDDKTKIYIKFGVTEGPQYRFGQSSFSGNLVYTSTELVKAIVYHRGKIFAQEKYEETIRAVQELYAERGRLRARVSPVKTFNQQTKQMDVHYGITEGDIVYIDHVDVEGNKATKTYVLKREIVTKSGDMFKASRIRKSREKIMNLGFIDDVDIDIQSPTDPDKVDLTFDVQEGKPGVLTAGAAYSSVDGFIGTLSLQHLNLFGRAQRASAQWSFGRRVQDYSVSWTTPWIKNSPTSLGVDLFNTRRINPFGASLSAYVEKNRGGTLRLGPRFEEDKYHLNLSYTFSQITITNVQNDFLGLLSEGTSNFSSASAELARDTRDSIWDPTEGSRNSVAVQVSGGPFGGDIHFFKPSVNNSIHFKLFEVNDYPFVLTFANRASYVSSFSETKDVPVFSRFYLGGQDTLRGYLPAGQVGFATGGKVMELFNAEFGFPLAREHRKTIVKLVTFFDAGTAWDNVRSMTYHIGPQDRDIKTDVGIGIRFTTPAFPIRLDWGYGFNHIRGEKRYELNFGLGNLF
jgi:outer membrane protein insertion porin family